MLNFDALKALYIWPKFPQIHTVINKYEEPELSFLHPVCLSLKHLLDGYLKKIKWSVLL